MRNKHFLLTIVLTLICGRLFAQIIPNADHIYDKDDRTSTFGFFFEYGGPGEKEPGKINTAFSTAIGFGLNYFKPVYTVGNGTNIGDNNGDLTFSVGAKDFLSNSDNLEYPDWTTYSALLGFRFSFGNLLFIEPQGGYSYGTYSNNHITVAPSNAVSGVTYGARAGLTFIKGLDFYTSAQTVSTKEFGAPFDFFIGMDLHL